MKSRVGTMVRALSFHQCGLGSILVRCHTAVNVKAYATMSKGIMGNGGLKCFSMIEGKSQTRVLVLPFFLAETS